MVKYWDRNSSDTWRLSWPKKATWPHYSMTCLSSHLLVGFGVFPHSLWWVETDGGSRNEWRNCESHYHDMFCICFDTAAHDVHSQIHKLILPHTSFSQQQRNKKSNIFNNLSCCIHSFSYSALQRWQHCVSVWHQSKDRPTPHKQMGE